MHVSVRLACGMALIGAICVTTAAAPVLTPARILEGHRSDVFSVAFSPDGALVATGAMDGTVRLWDAQTGVQVRLVQGGSWVHSVAFSPDAVYLATGARDRAVRIWRVEDGAEVQVLRSQRARINWVAYSPDGALLASASDDGTVALWRTDTWSEVRTLEGHAGPVMALAFSPDGLLLASGGGDGDDTIRLWEVATGSQVARARGCHTRALAFSPDGSRLASTCLGGTVLWSVPSLGRIRVLAQETMRHYSVAYSPDGRWVAAGRQDATVRIWDADTGALIATLGGCGCGGDEPAEGHRGGVLGIAFSPDGRWLLSGSADNRAMLWDLTVLPGDN